MKNLIACLFILQLTHAAFEQTDWQYILPETTGLNNSWSVTAAIIRPIILPFLQKTNLKLIYPLKRGGLLMNLSSTGDRLYRELTLSSALDLSVLAEYQQLLRVNFYQLKIMNYGTANCFSLDGESIYRLAEKSQLAINFSNLYIDNKSTISADIEQEIVLLFHHKLAHDHILDYHISQVSDHPLNHRIYWTLSPVDMAAIKLGFSSSPKEVYLAGSLILKSLIVKGGVSINPVTETTMIISLGYAP